MTRLTRLTCASCGRRLTKIAATLGRAPLGPVCARRMNLVATKNRATSARVTRAKPKYREENQMDLFEELTQ